jgi:hypothetical protein
VENWTLFDEHGCEVVLGPQMWPAWVTDQPSQRILIPAPLTPFPHRCKQLGIRFRAMQANAAPQQVAEFPLLTLSETGGEAISSTPLPATAPFKDLECRLLKLENGVDRDAGTQREPAGPSETDVKAVVELRRGAQAAPDWEPCGLRFTDASGEVLDPRPFVDITHKRGRTQLSFFGTLWAHEPAYDLDVELCKTDMARFAPEELRTVELKLPTIPVRVTQYANPHTFTFGDKTVQVFDPVWWGTGPPQLNIPMTIHPQPAPGPRIVLVDVIDEFGNRLTCPAEWQRNRYVHFKQPGIELTKIENIVKIKKRTRSITVTLALTQPEMVRFRVKPTQWKPPAPAKTAYANKFK